MAPFSGAKCTRNGDAMGRAKTGGEIATFTDEESKVIIMAILKGTAPNGAPEAGIARILKKMAEMRLDGMLVDMVLSGKLWLTWDEKGEIVFKSAEG